MQAGNNNISFEHGLKSPRFSTGSPTRKKTKINKLNMEGNPFHANFLSNEDKTMKKIFPLILLMLITVSLSASALERPDMTFKIYQFPHDQIPRIDGDKSDWDMVGADYTYGTDLLNDTEAVKIEKNPKNLDIKVRVGWVKGENRLYFLYEAYDNYWDFEGAWGDIFEIAVDGDLSGGPFIKNVFPDKTRKLEDLHFTFHGVHAQNYHIFTPPGNNDWWTMVWGGNPWISHLPYANYAYKYNFKQGESGKLILEFYITPFDYAPSDGPERAVESKLEENKIIGLAWNILEFEGNGKREGHWTLAPNPKMVYDASYLCAFKLMPLEEKWHNAIECDWSFKVVDMDRRLVAFKDNSHGKITKWLWTFGDGETSTEQNPIHAYKEPREYEVRLEVEGPAGKASQYKIWDVAVK